MIDLSKIKPNPNNPRFIRDDKFKKLCQSIKDFPEMMALRPIIIDENFINLGGNMRYKALIELGYSEVPNEWIKQVKDLTEEQKREFIIKDNNSFGQYDWDVIADNWDYSEITKWGVEIPGVNLDSDFETKDEYSYQNKVTIQFKTFEEATIYYENALKENYKATLS